METRPKVGDTGPDSEGQTSKDTRVRLRLVGIMKPIRPNPAPSITWSFPILGMWKVKRPPTVTEIPARAAMNIRTLKIVARIGDASTVG